MEKKGSARTSLLSEQRAGRDRGIQFLTRAVAEKKKKVEEKKSRNSFRFIRFARRFIIYTVPRGCTAKFPCLFAQAFNVCPEEPVVCPPRELKDARVLDSPGKISPLPLSHPHFAFLPVYLSFENFDLFSTAYLFFSQTCPESIKINTCTFHPPPPHLSTRSFRNNTTEECSEFPEPSRPTKLASALRNYEPP